MDANCDIGAPSRVPLVLTAEQAAALLQVSIDTILNLHRTRQLPAIKIGKHNRWRMADIEKFVERLADTD